MSGFAGIISLDGPPPDRELLDRMAAHLAFRGPDATHITTQNAAGFVFAFLRTGPAPQSPQQPCTIDGRVWLIGDVRLDGREDLRNSLEQHGAKLEPSVTDEELILHAYRMWGGNAFSNLIGDYAFALWDSAERRLLCLRDLIGARPFFYALADGQLLFSNTLNALRLAPQISADLDLDFVGDFLLQGWCADLARSAFRQISRLPPAHLLSYSGGDVAVRRFTSLPIEEPLFFNQEEEYVERFRTLLEQAVLDRLPRGTVAVFMSGGLDSTSVAAIAVHAAKKRSFPLDLRAYTVDYNPLFEDPEGALARQAAQYFQIPIDVLSGADVVPYQDWDSLVPQMPEPLHEPLRTVSVTATRRAAEHARVFFTGYGGDGIMTGQAWPYAVDLLRRRQFGSLIGSFGRFFLRNGHLPPLRAGLRARLRFWKRKNDPVLEYPTWLASQFAQKQLLRDRWHELQRPERSLHPWHPFGYAALSGPTWPTTLEIDDAPWHSVPVEGRAPLLDLRLQRFLLRLPPIPHCTDKRLLRDAMLGLLANETRLRKKTPLCGDPLSLHLERGAWAPSLPPPSPNADLFINFESLQVVLRHPSRFCAWRDLRPLSLFSWTKHIANGQMV